jgi:hypothetical protein
MTFFYRNTEIKPGSGSGRLSRYSESLGLNGPGIESRWSARFSLTRLDKPLGPPSHLCNGYPVFPGGKAARA